MKLQIRRLISLLLVLTMVVSLFSTTAFASNAVHPHNKLTLGTTVSNENTPADDEVVLDLSGREDITEIDSDDVPADVTKLDVSNCVNLTSINLDNRPQVAIVLDGCTALTDLSLEGYGSHALDLSACTNLQNLNLAKARLTKLDITALTKLKNFDISGSEIAVLTSADTVAGAETAYSNAFNWNWNDAKLDLSEGTAESVLKNAVKAHFNSGLGDTAGQAEFIDTLGVVSYYGEGTISFGSEKQLDYIELRSGAWESDPNPTTVTISVSSNGSTYTTVVDKLNTANVERPYRIELGEGENGTVAASYVKIKTTGSNYSFITFNFDIYGSDAPGFTYSGQQPAYERAPIEAPVVPADGADHQALEWLEDSYAAAKLVRSGALVSSVVSEDWIDSDYAAAACTMPEDVRVDIIGPDGESYVYPTSDGESTNGLIKADKAGEYEITYVGLTGTLGFTILTVGEVCAHQFSEWTQTDPSCDEEGRRERVCEKCGTKKVERIPATGHNYESTITEPTCTEDGYTTHVCATCGDSYVDNTVYAPGHDYVSVVTPPTETEQGYTTHTCSRCGDSYVDSWTDPEPPVDENGLLDLSGREDITEIDTDDVPENVKTLDVSDCINLTSINLDNRPGVALIVDGCTALTDLSLVGYGNHELDLSTCTNLQNLNLSKARLTSLDITTLTKLHSFNISNSEISILTSADTQPGAGTAYTNAFNWNWNGARLDLSEGTAESVLKNAVQARFDTGLGDAIGQAEYINTCGVISYTGEAILSLGSEKLLDYVELRAGVWESDPTPTTVTISVSTNGSAYTTVVDKLNTANVEVPYRIELGSGDNGTVAATYIKIKTTGSTYNFITFNFDIYGTDAPSFTYSGQQPVYEREPIAAPTVPADGTDYQSLDWLKDSYASAKLVRSGVLASNAVNEDWIDSDYASAAYTVPSDVRVDITGPDGEAYVHPASGFGDTNGVIRADNAGVYEISYVGFTGVLGTTTLTVGNACEHEYGEWTQKDPTCEEDGTRERVCGKCGNVETETLPALGHHYESTVTEPTCTEDGYTTHTCPACGDSYVDSIVDATGHDYESVVTPPTETEKGYTTHTCVKCGDSYIDSWTDAVGGHEFIGTVTKEPTCTEEGEMTYSCDHCDISYTAPISKTDHDYETNVVPATCTGYGYTEYACANCDHSYIGAFQQPTGHEFSQWTVTKEATCTEKGVETRACDCGETETRETDMVAHSYKPQTVEPTCTKAGYTRNSCTVCGDSYIVEVLDPVGHTFSDWTVTTEPTCTDRGVETRTCEICGEAETREIPTNCPAEEFTDLDTDQWYHEGVCYALENGLMNGMGDGKFAPNANMTRGQLVTVLYRMAGSPSVDGLENPFQDVAADTWYTNAIIWAVNEEIVTGLDATTFAPEASITREQLATILFRYAGAKAVEVDALDAFADADTVNGWAKDAMNWAVYLGLINGMDEATLAPQGNTTRAQIATILMRYCR